jgi:hypothetical protein
MFKERTHVSHATFRFSCEKSGPFLKKQQTRFKRPISVEERVAMSLARLGTEDGLCMVGEVYGVAKCIVSKIVREFCKMGEYICKRFLFKPQTKTDLEF